MVKKSCYTRNDIRRIIESDACIDFATLPKSFGKNAAFIVEMSDPPHVAHVTRTRKSAEELHGKLCDFRQFKIFDAKGLKALVRKKPDTVFDL